MKEDLEQVDSVITNFLWQSLKQGKMKLALELTVRSERNLNGSHDIEGAQVENGNGDCRICKGLWGE